MIIHQMQQILVSWVGSCLEHSSYLSLALEETCVGTSHSVLMDVLQF